MLHPMNIKTLRRLLLALYCWQPDTSPRAIDSRTEYLDRFDSQRDYPFNHLSTKIDPNRRFQSIHTLKVERPTQTVLDDGETSTVRITRVQAQRSVARGSVDLPDPRLPCPSGAAGERNADLALPSCAPHRLQRIPRRHSPALCR